MPIHPSITAYFANFAPDHRLICEQLAEMIERHLPQAEAKIWHAHPVWFINGNPIVGYSLLKSGIRLLFWSGQSFTTPGLSPEGTFKAAEYRFTHPHELQQIPLPAWLEEAARIQWDYKNLIKRKGQLEKLF